ncbi:MAG TPA: NAD(P)H-binding protein [Thermoanaerobaculia bacterium]|jgi:uncharacterized protein YbjT (DUF2867 family)|nr:NAD(P)H-binding protein [Thermoanaerobaculia bacterium]
MRIAVAGATGRVGRHVVELLEGEGHDVVPISRSHGVDVVTGEGLAHALAGAEAIVDASSTATSDEKTATDFFLAATHNLQRTAASAGVRRIGVVSIIGIERFPSGYLKAKVSHEKAMLAGPVPVRILRAAQFHEFVAPLVDWGRDGQISRLPKMKTQLVAARTVAQALADLATDPRSAPAPAGAPPLEIAGPRPEILLDAARRLVARRGDAIRVEEGPSAAYPDGDGLYASGALLPGPGATLAGPTFDEWLDEEYPRERSASVRPEASSSR